MLSTKRLTSLMMLIALLFVSSGVALAQQQQQMPMPEPVKSEDVTDAELKQFAATAQKMQQARMQSNMKVKQKVEDKGLKFERFRKIMMSKQNPKMAGEIEVTDREEKLIKELQPELVKIQKQSRQEMMTAMQNSELEMQRFQQIAQSMQQSQKLQQRMQEIQQEQQQADS